MPTSADVAAPTAVENKNTTPKADESVVADNVKTIKSPMIGTFYRSSDPDKEPFVKVGDKIKVGDVLCIIESMKLFNEIKSDVSGKIVKVMADNAQAVEYDQAIFLIE
jgi:acetyl-CoA carboxylase biotin carboxyl carrier protein